MAEGWLRHLDGAQFDVVSAGTHPVGLNARAVTVMKEAGVDISNHRSKRMDELSGRRFDYVITVCDRAKETCPVFPGATSGLHWSIDDPADAQGEEEAQLAVFRRVRDGIAQRVREFIRNA
ncbi:MAG: arsenate reductase ArsC [Nitrospiraceae bacterium]